MKKLLLSAIVILGFTAVSFGQTLTNSATATATTTIENPLTIAKAQDMAFGKVYASNTETRDLILSTAGVRSGTAGFDAGSTTNAASFTVSGTKSTAYTITLPAGSVSTTTFPNGASAMLIDTWTSDPATTAGALDGNGSQTIKIGATLHLGAAQTAGDYTASFTVMVNYN